MVVGFTCAYAFASTRRTALSSLVSAVAVTTVLGASARAATATLAWSGLVVLPLALIALRLWRSDAVSVAAPTRPSGAQLSLRAVLTGVLVAGLSTSSHVLGAGLTGVLASVPLVMAVVPPSAHHDAGSPAARSMLRGTLSVVPGTAAFAAVLAITLVPLGGPVAFLAAGVSLALTTVPSARGKGGVADRYEPAASARAAARCRAAGLHALTGPPPHYLGLRGDQPASADAVRSAEAALLAAPRPSHASSVRCGPMSPGWSSPSGMGRTRCHSTPRPCGPTRRPGPPRRPPMPPQSSPASASRCPSSYPTRWIITRADQARPRRRTRDRARLRRVNLATLIPTSQAS